MDTFDDEGRLIQEINMANKENLEGLNGWLILVTIVIVSVPFKIMNQVLPGFLETIRGEVWKVLGTPGSAAYNPFYKTIVYGEIAVNCGLLFAWIFIAFLFLSKKKVFPKWFIGISIFNLVFMITDVMMTKLILPDVSSFSLDTIVQFGRQLVFMAVWIPYMLVSKRVKATFVK